MEIVDAFTVRAPLEEVWDFLFDLERMGACVPGVKSIERVDENTYRGKLGVKLGPVTATFDGTATLTELDPPRRIVASLEADDRSLASFVKATFASTLNPIEGGTEVAYRMDLSLRGRLAQFGSGVIGATVKKLTAEFARNMMVQLESG